MSPYDKSHKTESNVARNKKDKFATKLPLTPSITLLTGVGSLLLLLLAPACSDSANNNSSQQLKTQEKELKEDIGQRQDTESKQESEEMLRAKHQLRWIHDLQEGDANFIYKPEMAREPFVQQFNDDYASADTKCYEKTLDGEAAEIFKSVMGKEYYSEICELYIEGNHLANIEFLYSEKGGEFLGLSNSELMFN
jgi:hypothetical protein